MAQLNLDMITDLDRPRLQALIDRLKASGDGLTIVSLLREFREQLSGTADRQAA